MKWDLIPQQWQPIRTLWYCDAERISFRRGSQRGWIDVVVDLKGRNQPPPRHHVVALSLEDTSALICNKSNLISVSRSRPPVDLSHEAPAGITSWLFYLAVQE